MLTFDTKQYSKNSICLDKLKEFVIIGSDL